MGQAAVSFVQALQDEFDLPSERAWKALGGQTWLDTMVARAYLADGMAETYKAAQSSNKIVLVDFSSENKRKITLNRVGDDEQIHIDEQQPRNGFSLLHGGGRPKDEYVYEEQAQSLNSHDSLIAQDIDSELVKPIPDTISSPYADNGDGTVTDTRTGLIWQRCAVGQMWNGISCVGKTSVHKQKQALALRVYFAGRSDWRLPTIDELKSIIEQNEAEPAINMAAFPNTPSSFFWSSTKNPGNTSDLLYAYFGNGTIYANGSLKDSHRFRLVRGKQYASNTRLTKVKAANVTTNQTIKAVAHKDDEYLAIPINADGLPQANHPVSDKSLSETIPHNDQVIAATANAYLDNRNGTITDPRTGLIWMRCLLGQRFDHTHRLSFDGHKCTGTANTYTWENAELVQHQYAGHNNWRLPTIKELESIFGERSDRNENKATFPWFVYEDDIFSTTCVWSSSTGTEMDAFTVYAYHPSNDSLVHCFDDYLDDHHQILLVHSIEGGSNANIGANKELQNISNRPSPPDEIISSAIDSTNIASPVVLLRNMTERFDQLEARFEEMTNRIELLAKSLTSPQSRFAIDVLPLAQTGRIDVALPVETTYLEFLYWLVEQQGIAFSDLRTRLLPLDLLPGAVINDINERALDLTGEAALEEDGVTVIVHREVLLQIIDAWDVL